jgi:hypothetical protein
MQKSILNFAGKMLLVTSDLVVSQRYDHTAKGIIHRDDCGVLYD